MHNQAIFCPLKDIAKCKLSASLELSGDRGIVQTNCHTCGHGQAVTLAAAEAEAMHGFINQHVEPPKPEATDGPAAGDVPEHTRKPSGQLP